MIMKKYYVFIFAISLLLSCKRSNNNVEFKLPENEPEIVENEIEPQKQEVEELSYKNLSSIEEFEVADENLRRWKNYMNKILDSCYRNYDDVIDEAAKEYTLTEEEIINLKKKYHDHLENSQENWSNYVKDMIELEYKYEIPGYIGSGTDYFMLKTEIEYVKKRVKELKDFIVIIGGSA
jgi:hypothetical protein